MKKRIYVAATSQHVGKTTSTLGLVASLKELGLEVGYCKPAGQQYVRVGKTQVDKDALLFSRMMGFKLVPQYHSPVVIGAGLTTAYIDNPSAFNFKDKILEAARYLEEQYDIVVYEGTGHPGVGSVIDLSNADVAKLLDAPVIMIVEGGIGRTIDQLNTNLALFREKEVPVVGVIVNKVLPRKIDKVRHYIGKKLCQMGISLLGVIPYDKSLSNPIMETIRQAVKGKVLLNRQNLNNKVENIVSGALAEKKEVESLHNLLLIVNHRRLDNAIASVEELASLSNFDTSPISGILINGEGDFIEEFLNNFSSRAYVEKYKIPIIATSLDTFGSAVKISQIEVKINTRTPWKVQRAVELIHDYIDLRPLIE